MTGAAPSSSSPPQEDLPSAHRVCSVAISSDSTTSLISLACPRACAQTRARGHTTPPPHTTATFPQSSSPQTPIAARSRRVQSADAPIGHPRIFSDAPGGHPRPSLVSFRARARDERHPRNAGRPPERADATPTVAAAVLDRPADDAAARGARRRARAAPHARIGRAAGRAQRRRPRCCCCSRCGVGVGGRPARPVARPRRRQQRQPALPRGRGLGPRRRARRGGPAAAAEEAAAAAEAGRRQEGRQEGRGRRARRRRRRRGRRGRDDDARGDGGDRPADERRERGAAARAAHGEPWWWRLAFF